MDPSFTLIAGPLKAGKTSTAIAAFPTSVFIAAPGALAPAEAVWGIPQPLSHDLETFLDIIRFIDKGCAGQLAKAPGVVIDDASLIADRTITFLTNKGIGGYDLWGSVFAQCIRLRDNLRRIGKHVIMTCHLAPPETKDGILYPGGPQFPGQTRTKLPAAADFLLRAERAPDGLDAGLGWPMRFRCGPPTAQWLQGSRYDTPDPAPMNLREILNLAGFLIPRLPGLEWQEKVAETLAALLLAAPGPGNLDHCKAIIGQVRDACATQKKNPVHVWWAIQDGYDRARLRAAKAMGRGALWGLP